MTTYAKTIAGRLHAFDPLSALPANLKHVLKLVDSKTPTDQLCDHVNAPPDAEQLLQELLRRKLIQDAPARWADSAANSAFVSSAAATAAKRSASAAVKRDLGTGELGDPAAASQIATAQAARELDEAKTFMSTFMAIHLPELSALVNTELDGVDNYAKLDAMLGGYAELVSRAGRNGLVHIKTLRGLMDKQTRSTRASSIGIDVLLDTIPSPLG